MIVHFFSSLSLVCATSTLVLIPSVSLAAQQHASLDSPLDQEQRQKNWNEVAAEVAAADRNAAGIARDVRELLRRQNIVDPYMASYGMSSADLGDVLALARFSAVIMADGGRTDDPTQAQIEGVRTAIAGSATPDSAALSGQEKRRLADLLLHLVILQNAVAEAFTGQPALYEWMSAFATTNSEMLGFDVTRARVGPSGLANGPSSLSQDSAIGAVALVVSEAASIGSGTNEILGVCYQNSIACIPEFTDGILKAVNTLTVLLKDGKACHNCLSDVLEGSLASAAIDQRDMARWHKRGQTYVITFEDGDTREFEANKLHEPAPKCTTLSGSFKGVSGTSTGIDNTLTIDYLDFRTDGSFVADGGTSSVGAYAIASVDRAARTGRYSINGYRIIFECANGARDEASFVLYDTDDEFNIIHQTPHYIPDD